jgi:hypothetical protein
LGLLSIVGSNGDGSGGGGGPGNLPIGTYSSNDHKIALRSDGTFTLVNYSNTNDGRNFTISGNYTSTLDGTNDGNTYGKLEFTVTSLELGERCVSGSTGLGFQEKTTTMMATMNSLRVTHDL